MALGVKLTEFYEERQGRPASAPATDMDSRQSTTVISSGGITIATLDASLLTYYGTVVTRDGNIVYR